MESEKQILKDWSDLDKPREKAMMHGVRTLSDSELLAILLRTGNQEDTAVALARKILSKANNNLATLSRMTIHDLQNSFKGIGSTKAITILAALELGRRSSSTKLNDSTQIRSSIDIFNIFGPLLGHLPHEEFWLLMLNHNNKVIDQVQISQGGVAATVVDVKLVMKHALERLSSNIALCHNHPSGNRQASKEDIGITLKIKEACKAMDINLLDHIIIADKSYYSFADNNVL